MADYVWYACYGSNLLYDRFMCYITGGIAPGSSHVNPGARDQSPPTASELFRINRNLYFGGSSKAWQNKGVAFIGVDTTEEAGTLSRIYRITREQFEDVFAQENRDEPGSHSLPLQNFDPGDSVLVSDSWYGRLIYVAKHEGEPVLSFTGPEDLAPEKRCPPSIEYLSVIISGLLEAKDDMTEDEIVQYFSDTEAKTLGEDIIRNIVKKWRGSDE